MTDTDIIALIAAPIYAQTRLSNPDHRAVMLVALYEAELLLENSRHSDYLYSSIPVNARDA